MEYFLEIRPTKLTKGQGLARLLAESNYQALQINYFECWNHQDSGEAKIGIGTYYKQSEWYKDIVHFLQTLQFQEDMDKSKAQDLKLKAIKYYFLDNNLYWKDPCGLLLNCLVEYEAKRIMNEFHKGDCGGHHY